mgnify:CR=1 FL=1
MAPTRAAPRPLVESNTRERNNDACFESGPAPERRRPGAERALAAAAALDHGDRANYRLWYESAVRRHDNPRPMRQASDEAPRKAWPVPLCCTRPVVMPLAERDTKDMSSSSNFMGCLRDALDVTACSDASAAGSGAAFASRDESLLKSNLRARASVHSSVWTQKQRVHESR